jgi:hypothetical protein
VPGWRPYRSPQVHAGDGSVDPGDERLIRTRRPAMDWGVAGPHLRYLRAHGRTEGCATRQQNMGGLE